MSTDNGDELAQVIPLHGRRKIDPVTVLREALADRGAADEDLMPGGVTPKVWRATARKVARDLGWPVCTGQADHEDDDVATVWAGLADWPRTPEEVAAMEASKQRIADAMTEAFPLPPGEYTS